MKIWNPTLPLLLLAALLAPGSAAAAEDGAASASPGPAKLWRAPLVIPAAEFRNDGRNPEGYVFNAYGHMTGTGTAATMFAPAYLPDGAVVNGLTAYVYDNNDDCGSPDVELFLRRVSRSDGTADTLAHVLSTGTSAAVQPLSDTAIDFATVDNLNYAYFVYVTLCSASHELNAVLVDYLE